MNLQFLPKKFNLKKKKGKKRREKVDRAGGRVELIP